MTRGAIGALCVTATLLWGCERRGPSAEEEARTRDAAALRAVLNADPALPVLEEVRQVVEEDLPVRAADLLEMAAIPAARRQTDAVGRCTLETQEGRALQRRAQEAYRARLAALRDYRRALARGPIEDLVLLDAVHALRASEEELAAVHASVQALGAPGVPATAPAPEGTR